MLPPTGRPFRWGNPSRWGATSVCTRCSRRPCRRVSRLAAGAGRSPCWRERTDMPPLRSGIENETVAASQTDQVLGATGGAGDYLTGLLIVPATTSPGAVSIKDGGGSAVTVF